MQKGAGTGAGIGDQAFEAAGAKIVAAARRVFKSAELIFKVKEPLPQEYPLLRQGQVLFAYLHLAADRALTEALLAKKVVGDPTYVVDGVVHCFVANMPGAYARTSTFALTNVTTPDAVQIADKGWLTAARENAEIPRGLNVVHGHGTNQPVALAHRLRYVPWTKVES